MALFDKDKRESRQKDKSVRKEERATMKRAEAMASSIDEKPTNEGYSFNPIENEAKVKEANSPGLTVVTGAEPLTFNEQRTVSYTPEQVTARPALQQILATSDQDNIAANAIAKEGYSKAKTQEEIDQVSQDSQAAKDLEEQEKSKLQAQLYTGPANTIVNATSTYLQNIGNQPGAPSYMGGEATKERIGEDVAKTYSNINNQIPNAVLEKLGVQDYYPQAGRDVAVGTFTGSRIGSQTIYSGAGALLPMGLYDARKKALATAAKEKQALVDKYSDIIETAPQYQEPFNQVNAEWFNQMWDKHKGDANSFLKDPEVRKEHARRLGLAKEIKNYSDYAETIVKDFKDEKKYVTKEMLQNAIDIKAALVDRTEDVVSGKLDLGKLFAKAKVYQDMIPQLDNVLNRVLDASKLGQSPVNLRTGGEYDSDKFKNEANQFIQMAKTGNINYNDFVTGFKKYFTGDYEQIIDGMIQSGKYSEEQKEAAMNYFAGQLQEQVVLDHKILDSKALGWSELEERKRQFNSEYARKREEGKTHWQVRRDEMNFVDKQTGKPMSLIIEDLKNKGIKGEQLNRKILDVARRNGIQNATIDPYTNSVVIKEQASENENKNTKGVNNSSLWVNLKEQIVKDGKKTFKYFSVKAIDLDDIDLKRRKISFEDDTHFTPEIQGKIKKAIKDNKLKMQVNSYDIGYGYADPSKNDIITINPENISGYNSDRVVYVKKDKGRLKSEFFLEGGKKVDVPLPGTFYIKNEFSSDPGTNSADKNWGQGIESEPGFGLGQGPIVETGSYSSSSVEE